MGFVMDVFAGLLWMFFVDGVDLGCMLDEE
jgi:hypothetical protein